MPELQTNGAAPAVLAYDDVGSGAPVVLVHGWPLSSRSWEPQILPLVQAGHRVITYDRRGFGNSSRPFDGYDYDTLAADLHALLEHLDLQEVTLVGFSMGGGEVARYLGTYGSGRIARAVFAGAVPPYLYVTDDHPDGALDDAAIAQFEAGVRADRVAFVDDFARQFFDAGGTATVSEPLRAFMAWVAAVASPKGTLDCIGAFSRTDFRDDLAKIDVPTLVIHGDHDAIVPFEASGRRTAELVKGAELVVIEGGPHGINASHTEEFNEALLGFLGS